MAVRRKIIVFLVILAAIISIYAQGLAITIVMEKLSQNVDERFFAGRFYWKPQLPALYRPAKAGFVHGCGKRITYSPPFSPIYGGK